MNHCSYWSLESVLFSIGRSKCIRFIGKPIVWDVLCRGVYCTVSLSRRVHSEWHYRYCISYSSFNLQDPVSSETAIFVQGVIPGSTAENCTQLNTGDKILAIDGQLLDGADYIM